MPKNNILKLPRHGPSVADFKKMVTVPTRGGSGEVGEDGKFHPGLAVLAVTDFLASILGMKTQLRKEDQQYLDNLIEQKREAKQIEIDKKLGRDVTERIEKLKLQQKDHSETLTRKQLANQAARELKQQKIRDGRAHLPLWLQGLSSALGPVWRNVAPYIALVMAIFIIVIIFQGGLKQKKHTAHSNPLAKLRKQIRGIENAGKNIHFPKTKKFIERIFHPTYKLKHTSNLFSGGAHANGLERPNLASGRCDNLKWAETTGEGKKGSCDTTVHPIDITWNIDSTSTPEYYELPQSRKDELEKYGTVKIPWDVNPEASYYVPQCEKAYYPKTCTTSGICVKADMFEDLGLSCKRKEDKLPTQYPLTQSQPNTTATFDDKNSKKCIDINTLKYVPCP